MRQDTDTKVDNVLRRVEAMEIRVEEVRQSLRDARGMTTPDTGTPRSMQEGSASMATENGFTAVLGGFKGAANQDELERWVSRSLWSVGANMPTVLYIKGEFSHFNGVAFGKYTSKMERDAVVSKLQAAGLEYGGQKMWSKIELPLEPRVIRSLLFGAKNMFVEWGWDKKALWVDEDEQTLTCGKDEIVFTVKVEQRAVKIDFGPGWAEYIEPQNDVWAKLIQTANSKISKQSSPTKGTGKGKGKSGKE